MKLRDYLAANSLTLDTFAARIGRSAATVSRIARGLHRPDWQTMTLIEAATSGVVTPNDFRDDRAQPDDGAQPTEETAAA